MSHHFPILLQLNLGALPETKMKMSKSQRKPAWSKASDEHLQTYTHSLQRKLCETEIPRSIVECCDLKCNDERHRHDRDNLLLDILCSMVEESYSCIPVGGGGRTGQGRTTRGQIPGWTEEVEPLRRESIYWHRVWMKNGRPSDGFIHEVMAKKRAQYH